MAIVDGFTKARMLEIEGSTVVAGLVDIYGHLLLEKRNGDTVDAGLVLAPNLADATTVVKGISQFSTDAIALTGTATDKVLTASNLGYLRASQAEVLAGTSKKLVTPENLALGRDNGVFDSRYYTETEINTLLNTNTKVGVKRVIPSSVAKAGTGTVVVDSDGTVRVTASGPTAISLNDILQTGKNYELDIIAINTANANNAFRFRKAGADYSGNDYVWGAFYDTLTWIGSQSGSGYAVVNNGPLLSVNGKYNMWSKIWILNRSNTSSQYFHFISNSRDGSQQTIFSGSGDQGVQRTQTGFTLISGGGNFDIETQIKVWEFQ